MIKWPEKKTEKFAFIFWFCILGAVTVGSLLPKLSPPGDSFGFDKILHASAFVLLSGIPLYAVSNRKAAILIALSVAPYGYLLEFLQQSIPGREFSPQDLIANNLGALLGLALGVLFRVKTRYFSAPGENK